MNVFNVTNGPSTQPSAPPVFNGESINKVVSTGQSTLAIKPLTTSGLTQREAAQNLSGRDFSFVINLPVLKTSHHLNIHLKQNEKQMIMANYIKDREAVKLNVNDMGLRAVAVESKLHMAGLTENKEKIATYVTDAKKNIGYLIQQSYESPWGHYCKFLVHAFEGIDCSDMDIVKENLLALRRAIRLRPMEKKFTALLEKVCQDIKTIFVALKQGSHIDESVHQTLLQNLEQILSMNPFTGS